MLCSDMFNGIMMSVVSRSESYVDIGSVISIRKAISVNRNIGKISYWCITSSNICIVLTCQLSKRLQFFDEAKY